MNSEKFGDGINFFAVLGAVFIVLKLAGVIDWSWWTVTLPLWGPILIGIVIFILAWLFEL